MLNGVITWKGWTLTQHNGTGLWTAIKGGEKLPAKSTTASLRALIDAIEGPEARECCTWKGWTLTKHNGTGLWAAIKGGEKLPAKSTTASLRALIDAIEGPQVKECCTGGGCHV